MAYKLIDFERLRVFSEKLKTKYATKNDIPKKLSDLQDDTTHRLVTDIEKKRWNDKVSQSQITGDANATGSDKVWNVDFVKKQFQQLDSIVNAKIDKSHITDTFTGASSDMVLSQKGAQDLLFNINQNTYQDIMNKAEKSDIPTKLSQLTNDKTFKTESEIQSMIEKASSLKKEVVTSLPTTGKDDVIYLVKDEKGKDNNNYLEYLWLNGKYELIGSTQVDLSGYAKKTEVVTSVNGKKGDMMVDFFIGDDTRHLNYAPKDYLEHGARYKSYTNSQFEFKRCTTVGVDRLITQDYCIVNTQVPWADKSGGYPMQIAYGKGVIAIREGVNETTWSEWQKVSTTDDLSEYLKTNNIYKAKLKTNKSHVNVFTDRSTSKHPLDIILGDLELRTEKNKKNIENIQEFTQQELEEAFK